MKIKQGKVPCPCSSSLNLESCCGPLIYLNKPAATAEALMRSRYTANVKKAFKYSADTWYPNARPSKIEIGSKIPWLRLEVLSSTTDGDKAWVEFKAFYGHNNHEHAMHEKSFFVFENQRWWYVDGENLGHQGCGGH